MKMFKQEPFLDSGAAHNYFTQEQYQPQLDAQAPPKGTDMGRWFDDDLTGSDVLHLMGMRERMKRLFDDDAERENPCSDRTNIGWSPAVDIHDGGAAFILTAELPGVQEGDIDLQVVGDSLVLTGERIPNTGEKVVCYHRVERPEGPFRRVFRLPDEVDAQNIRAECRDGVLRVELPKLVGEGKKISVNVE